jgi:hypothetical protein
MRKEILEKLQLEKDAFDNDNLDGKHVFQRSEHYLFRHKEMTYRILPYEKDGEKCK